MVRGARARSQSLLANGLRQLSFDDFVKRLARQAKGSDPTLFAEALFGVVLGLMALGLLIQASHAATVQEPGGYHGELIGQLLFRVAGLAAIYVGYRFGPRGVRPLLGPLWLLAAGLLVAVYIPGLRAEVNGSKRWIDLGLKFQPSELARLVLVLWVADRCTRLGQGVAGFKKGVLPMLGATLFFFCLVLGETDLGGSLLLLLCALSVMWVGGAQSRSVGVSALVIGGGAFSALAALIPYVRHRIAVWFGQAHNEQVSQTFRAIAHGGVFGTGLGQGEFRNQGVPYLQSDYVFAQIGEELGLVGMLILLGLLIAFMWFSLRLVLSLSDRYDALAAFGLLLSVCLQGMIHCQVVARLAPSKGMTLPFISDGGTSLIVSSLAVGLALGAVRCRNQEYSSCNLSNATAS